MAAPIGETLVHGAVTNIPSEFHSANLRNYFSQFIEQKGFDCFHFRHRPEFKKKDTQNSVAETCEIETQNVHKPSSRSPLPSQRQSTTCRTDKNKTTCCVVRLTEQNLVKFMRMYHRKQWVDKNGEGMAARCIILRIRVCDSDEVGHQTQYQTRGEQNAIPADRETFTQKDLANLLELHPPDIMPNGNVGTPTAVFLQFIRECRLPPRMIQKLGLAFPRTRSNKRYGNVPFDYGNDVVEGRDETEFVTTGAGHDILGMVDSEGQSKRAEQGSDAIKCIKAHKGHKQDAAILHQQETDKRKEKGDQPESESEEDDDDDTCEEWERHEALHNDVTNQERTAERLFESEMEVTWDKGSSGLVFYTDAAYWKELEGDFDEQTADDWDVDMSAYYDPDGGDKDARDLLQMRLEHRRRGGLETDSVFSKGVGKFEKHTKGIGRRVLERHGWKEGQGVGKNAAGMKDALDNEGKKPRDKMGLGYYGERLRHGPGTSSQKRRADREVIISTVYDDPEDNEPTEPLLRSNGPYHLNYRDEVKFRKADSDDR